MKKRIRRLKLISFVMSVLFVLLILPLSSIAYALETKYEVLNEVVELREENVKHFENPDGSYTAIMYNNAVHRKDSNGNWQDIDNRMSESETKNKQAYITSDGRIAFTKKIKQDDNEIYTLSENGYKITVSFANDNIKNSNAKLSNHASKYTPSGRDDLDTQYKKVKQIDNNTTLLYKNTLKGIDLEYVLSSNNVKENIIVKALQDEYSYTFIYSLENLVATLNEDGSVSLFDSESGEERYSIPVPYMYDANGSLSYDVEYSLETLENGDYALTVTASSEWISSAELPVVIDPTTVYTFTGSASTHDTYIDPFYTNRNYGSTLDLYVSMSQIAYMRPTSLPAIPDDATLFYATVDIYYYYPSTAPEYGVELDVYPVVASWDEDTWTYNTASQHEFFGLENRDVGYAYLLESYTSNRSSPEYAIIDVTSIFASAYAGLPFYGVAFTYATEDYSSYISILSGENPSTTNSTYALYYQRDAVMEEDATYFLKSVQYPSVYIDFCRSENSIATNTAETWQFDENDSKKWNIEYLHNGYYKITSEFYNLALSSPYDEVEGLDETLTVEDYYAYERQQWSIISLGNGVYKISPRIDDSLFVSVDSAGDGPKSARAIQQKENQENSGIDEWYFAKRESDIFVELEGQRDSNWCWAATARMFAKYYYPSVSYTQEQAVMHVKNALVDVSGDREEAVRAIQFYISNINGATIETEIKENQIYSSQRVIDFIDRGHVIYASIGNYVVRDGERIRESGHAVLIYGYVTIGTECHLLIKNPLPENNGKHEMIFYNDFCYKSQSGEIECWESTIVKSTNFSNDTLVNFLG